LISWAIPRFPLKGGAIVARGIKAGPQVAQILRTIEEHWLAEDFPGDARIEELLREELARL
jgi:poly(A) polymerase